MTGKNIQRATYETAPDAASMASNLVEWLKVLAEPNRLRIVDLLMRGEQCNCEMGGKLNMAPNLISHHLRVLSEVGLVTIRRDEADARWVHYSMHPEALAKLTSTFAAFFDPARIPPRQPACAAPGSLVAVKDIRGSEVSRS